MDYKKEFLIAKLVMDCIFQAEWSKQQLYDEYPLPPGEKYIRAGVMGYNFSRIDIETGAYLSELGNDVLLGVMRGMDKDWLDAFKKANEK